MSQETTSYFLQRFGVKQILKQKYKNILQYSKSKSIKLEMKLYTNDEAEKPRQIY